MYLVRDIFNAKPGKAKDLVAKFKAMEPIMKEMGMNGMRVMTDAVAGYWTVVAESEVESLDEYFDMGRRQNDPRAGEIMQGYMDLVEGGRREVFRIE
ncbi:MAG TPA: hypothetical protein VGX68_15600 [Thermoanaerobaculia bacterium]|nr:hypothetical protein [Thermoanaerobaculia bacterium]